MKEQAIRKAGEILTVTEQIDQKHLEDLERLKNFRLMDDEFFTKCFEGDPKYIQLVLRIVLEMPDIVVTDVRTQVFVENLLKRSVRLDIVATDSAGRKINVEIQRSDKGAGRKRARYNSSMMDANLLRKSEDFDKLPETYVIFITEHDVIGKGKPLYHIGRYIFDTGESFNDGSHILYVNGEYRGNSDIGKLMHDFNCTDAGDMNFELMAERTRYLKENPKGVSEMCKVIEDMRTQERKEAKKEAKIDTAKRMIADGFLTLEKIAEYVGLSLDEVKNLQTGHNA